MFTMLVFDSGGNSLLQSARCAGEIASVYELKCMGNNATLVGKSRHKSKMVTIDQI
jgi:hypothetical protein